MKKIFYEAVAILMIGLLLSSSFYTTWASYSFEECRQIQANALRDELNRICRETFASESMKDVDRIVRKEWESAGMDSVIDEEVDKAVQNVQQESKLTEKIWSTFSKEKAAEFTQKVATKAFESDRFQRAVENLSEKIGQEVSSKLEGAIQETAFTALMCLRQFIQNEYSHSIADIFDDKITQATGDIKTPIDAVPQSSIQMHSKAFAGVGVIIASQIAKKVSKRIARSIASRIGGKLMGRVAGAFVPVIGWIIGTVLLAWDIYDSSQGAFPYIQKQLKQDEVKEQIRNEISQAVKEQLHDESSGIATEISDTLFTKWREFRTNHEKVLNLSEQYPQFRAIVDKSTSENDLYKLGKLVAIIFRKYQEQEWLESVNNGTFEQILNTSETAFALIDTCPSLADVINWIELSDREIDKVVEFEIYKHKSPKDFNSSLLKKLVSINEKRVVEKLILLDKPDMENLLKLSTGHLQSIAKKLQSDDLKHISWYVERFEQPIINILISRIDVKPSLMPIVRQENVKQLVLEIQDKQEAMAFLLSDSGYIHIVPDAFKLISGDVSLKLFFYKYSETIISVIILLIGLIITVMVIRRMLFPIR